MLSETDESRRMTRLRLTREGLERLEHDLRDLEETDLPEVADRIREIKATSSDLAESVEYSSALDDLARLQARAAELREMIGAGEVLSGSKTAKGEVGLGSRVTLAVDGSRETYQVVGSAEADALAGRISEASPLGRAVLGRHVGDEVAWRSPEGTVTATLLKVS